MAVNARPMDFSNVREGGPAFNKRRVAEGDYLAKVLAVSEEKVKKGENEGQTQWLFTIALVDKARNRYPYYCGFAENQLWKIRNLLVAAGINVPKKRVKVDPNRVVGKLVGVTMEDEEYDGKDQSVIAAVFPPSELQGDATASDEPDDDDDEDDEPPAPKAKKSKKRPEPDDEDDDGDDDEDDEDEKPKKKARKPEPEDDEDSDDDEDDDEDEEERKRAAKKKRQAERRKARKETQDKSSKRKKSKKDEDDDDLDDLELDDL